MTFVETYCSVTAPARCNWGSPNPNATLTAWPWSPPRCARNTEPSSPVDEHSSTSETGSQGNSLGAIGGWHWTGPQLPPSPPPPARGFGPCCLNKMPLACQVCIESSAHTLSLAKYGLCYSRGSGCNAREMKTVSCNTASTHMMPKWLLASSEAQKLLQLQGDVQHFSSTCSNTKLWLLGCCCE